jgi:hypothetical protein
MDETGRWVRRIGKAAAALLIGAVARTAAGEAPPPVPAEFQDLASFLGQKLDAFEAKLPSPGAGGPYQAVWTAELLSANGNRGRALLEPSTLSVVRIELDRLKSLGAQAVTIAIPFPVLSQPFLAWNGDPGDFQPLVAFFTQVAAETRSRGMKVAVESGAMFPGIYSAGSGMDAAAYYQTLTAAQFVAGRSAVIGTIVSKVKPDVINVGSEPDTEVKLTSQAFLGTPAGWASMMRTFVDDLAAAGLTGVPVVAGTGTWKYGAASFVTELCKIPGLWGIDLHVYPVNADYLDQALSLAAQAHAAGKHVTMLECWLQKERDSELGVLQTAMDPTLFARDAWSFWAPWDQRFLSLMGRYAAAANVEYLSPFWSRYFFAYLDYDRVALAVPPPTADEVIAMATAAHARALMDGETTSTGRAFASLASGAAAGATVSKIVPIILSANGVGGARFTTELTLANRGTSPASVRLAYTPAKAISSTFGNTVTLDLAAGEQRVIPDAVEFVRNKLIMAPTPENQGGILRVTVTGLSSPDAAGVLARTTTPSGKGRAGLAYPATSSFDAQTGPSFVFGLRSSADDRTNLALVNAGTSGDTTFRVALYSADGRRVTLPDTTLEAGQWTQFARVLEPYSFSSAFAMVTLVSGAGPYLAYAVANDNTTNDGSFLPSEPAIQPAEPRTLPVLVESAAFRSELVLANPTSSVQTVTLAYVESASPALGGGGAATVTLQPAEQRIVPEAIDFLRRQGIAIGPMGSATFAGALTATFRNPAGLSNGFVGARTAAAASGGGEYGLFIPGVGLSFGASTDTWIYGLEQNGSTRSNVALVNLGEGGDVVLRVDVYSGADGRLAGSPDPVTLLPGGWKQLDALLAPFGVSNGYARIVRLFGTSRFAAYGVVNDGATPSSGGTNDGSYVSMASY